MTTQTFLSQVRYSSIQSNCVILYKQATQMTKKQESGSNLYLRLMKIFEVMWLITAICALVMAITRGINGQSYGSYIYITCFTGAVALFMYRFKKKNRHYLESHYARQEELEKQKNANAHKS